MFLTDAPFGINEEYSEYSNYLALHPFILCPSFVGLVLTFFVETSPTHVEIMSNHFDPTPLATLDWPRVDLRWVHMKRYHRNLNNGRKSSYLAAGDALI